MDKTLSASLSLLHKTALKPVGFSKKAGTFSRTHATHTELFNIQSSQWNGDSGRSFYVNCGLTFADLPMEYSWMYFPGTQWAGRIDELVPSSPSQWGYTEDTVDSVMGTLGAHILLASAELSSNWYKYKQRYLERVEDILRHRQGLKA